MTANLATPQSGAMTRTDTPSVFFPHLATLFGFLCFSLSHVYDASLSLAVILLYLPHNSKLVVEKGGLCYSNCRLRVSDLCRSALHH